MFWYRTVALSIFLSVSSCEEWRFPNGFQFGAASSAYQVEGAWNVGGKGESIWDRFTHTRPYTIADNSNGDQACDSYYHWETDIDMAAELGLHFYRFSISWPRLLPTGFVNNISEEGKTYYKKLINGLLDRDIQPLVTLYHWDLPQSIQDLGGWTNPVIADLFGEYARVVFRLFGHQVKMWITINEPLVMCDAVYNTGTWAPGVLSPDHGAYLCNKNALMAHAKAYRIYDKEFRPRCGGEVSFSNLLFWFEPWTTDDTDIAELAIQYCAGRFSHPVYSTRGGWPPSIVQAIEESSKMKGYNYSTLPTFSKDDIEFVRGTYDFYAMNYYSAHLVREAEVGEELYSWPFGDIPDLNAVIRWRPEWPETMVPVMRVYPEGIRKQLKWLKNNYGDMKFIITENGYPTREGLQDPERIKYIRAHLKQLLLAIHMDDIHLTHYTSWTLMDGFEWADGYRYVMSTRKTCTILAPNGTNLKEMADIIAITRFGLYEVNFTDPHRTRTPRHSARFYQELIKNNAL